MTTAASIKTFSATSAADLVTNVNAWLATLTDAIIRSVSLSIKDRSRRLGQECSLLIEYEGPSAVPIITPWLIRIDEAGNLTDLETAVAAFLLANAGSFINVPTLISVDNDTNNKLSCYCALSIYNANPDAYQNFGATAQMAPAPI